MRRSTRTWRKVVQERDRVLKLLYVALAFSILYLICHVLLVVGHYAAQ